MRKLFVSSVPFAALLVLLLAGIFTSISAQETKLVVGEVSALGPEKIILTQQDGKPIDVVLTSSTVYKRVSPENPSLKTAVDASFEELGVGDKLAVTGKPSDDGKTIYSYKIFQMTRTSIVQKQARESQEWQTRGIIGKVEEIDPETKQITISVRSVLGEMQTVLTPKENAEFRRYAPDSNKYSESVKSDFAAIAKGDMIRALGDKSADSKTFAAEEIISGAFQTTAGTITAVEPEANQITITDIRTNQPVIITVRKSSVMKEFPAPLAQRLARFQMMQASGVEPPRGGGRRERGGQAGGNNEEATSPRSAGGDESRGSGTGPREGMAGRSIDELLERFPDISVADLKPGQMIAVSSTRTENAGQITAIKLLSGVEPFLTIPQAAAGRRGGRGGSQSPGFSIPGLDESGGISIP